MPTDNASGAVGDVLEKTVDMERADYLAFARKLHDAAVDAAKTQLYQLDDADACTRELHE
ncbi:MULTISPECIES: hypothetical protein [Pseudomonas]|uniref:Uncharacterized protein n=1 Tax=Pseudomonas lutea TaxID=243924 RepID=A0A9X8MFZ3_9PSED|nr:MULTISPECIES: hypothetical protein [Pseudomonas]SER17826.1 hypothetical protein SAMN05216409_113101 [Pseudomonas lutea]